MTCGTRDKYHVQTECVYTLDFRLASTDLQYSLLCRSCRYLLLTGRVPTVDAKHGDARLPRDLVGDCTKEFAACRGHSDVGNGRLTVQCDSGRESTRATEDQIAVKCGAPMIFQRVFAVLQLTGEYSFSIPMTSPSLSPAIGPRAFLATI